MEQYNVTGMSCAACSSRVEKAVSSLDGVTSCSVNLLTGSMGVEGTASDTEIITAVGKAGYSASIKDSSDVTDSEVLADKETPRLLKRLLSSLFFLCLFAVFAVAKHRRISFCCGSTKIF